MSELLEEELIKQEGFVEGGLPYSDIGGTMTIGFGYTKHSLDGEDGRPHWNEYWGEDGTLTGKTMSKQEAKDLMPKIKQIYSSQADSVLTNENISQTQKNALTNLIYRNGIGNVKNSGVIDALNSGDIEKAQKLIKENPNLRKSGGTVLEQGDEGYKGITNRNNSIADSLGDIQEEVIEEVSSVPFTGNNSSKKLHDLLVKKNIYSKSYDNFVTQFTNEESRAKLHKLLLEENIYSKSSEDFTTQFFTAKEDQTPTDTTGTDGSTVSTGDDTSWESSRIENAYINEGENQEDFYRRTMPKKEETIEQIYSPAQKGTIPKKGENISIEGITKGMFGSYTNQNGEQASQEEITRYIELEQLHNIRNEALAITSRSAGDYSDMPYSQIVEEGKEEKKEDVDVAEVGDIDQTLDYEFDDYLEYNQEELVNNYEAFIIKTNAPIIADQEKVQTELLNTKWEEFQETNKENINEDVKKIEQEIRSFYDPKFAKAKTQAEWDSLNEEMQGDFQRSVNLQVNKHYEDLFNDEMLEDEDLNAMGARHQEKWKKIQEQQWDQYVENFKPKYDTFTPEILDKIGEDLDQNYNFQYKNGPEKKMLLQRALDGYIRETGLPEGQTLEDAKDEYWSYFYKKLAFDPSSTSEDGTPTYSQWAYKDIATGALEESNKELTEETKKYKDKKVMVGRDAGGMPTYRMITAEQQALDARPELKRVMDFSQRVLDNPEEMSNNGFVNFWKGLTSLQGHEYIPIIGGVIELNNSAHFYKLAKKENRTKMEDLALSMYAIKNASDKKVSELGSTAYNGGKIGGGSVSFMGEVMLTSGLYTSVRKGIQKTIKETLDKKVSKIVASKIDDIMAKSLTTGRVGNIPGTKVLERQAKKQINYKIKENTSKVLSFVLASGAQTSVNPQRYLKGMYDNMTPEIAFAYTDQADGLIADLELNALVGSGDNPDLKDGDDPLKAFAKAFGTTWAEYATERLGELLPGMGKAIGDKIGLTSPDFLKRMSIGLVMRKMGFSTAAEASGWLAKTAGYHGVFAELAEEFVNMPLSNLINGETWNEGMDWQTTKEMTVGIAPTVFAFSGGNVVYNNMTNKSNPGYWVDYQKHETKEAALAHLNRLKEEGKLNKDTDIEVRNDFIAFDEISTFLEVEGLSNDIVKTSGSNVSEGSIVAAEVEIMDEIDDPNQRKEVEDRSDNIKEKQDVINNLEEFARTKKGATEKDKKDTNKKIQTLQKEITDLKAANEVIIAPIRDSIIKRKKTKAYQKGIDNLRNIYSKGNRGKNKDGSEILIEATTIEEVEALTRAEVLRQSGLRQEGNKYFDTKTGQEYEITPAENKIIESQIKEATTSHGSFTMDAKTGKKQVVINKVAALEGGGANVAGHEFLHHFLSETLAKNPELKYALGRSLENYIYNINPRQIRDTKFRDRVMTYQQDQGTVKAMEETLNILSDAIANGTYQYNESAMTKLGDIFRRIMSSFGIKVEFGEGRDVFNFIKDYNKAFESGELSAGLIETMEKGAKVTGDVKAIGEGFKKEVEAAGMTVEFLEQAGISFSKDSAEENKFNDILNNEVEASTGVKDFGSLDKYEQADVWNKISEQEKLIIGMQLGPLWRKFIRNKADEKYGNNPGWDIPDGADPIGRETGIRGEFLDKITTGIDIKSSPKDNGLPFIVKTWNPIESKLTTYIINNLPKRIPHTASTISGFSQVTTDITGAKDITVKPQDVILTEKVLDQYKTPLLSDLKFTKDQIKILRGVVLKIIGTKLKALDAAMSKNQSISPMIADMKKQLYVKNGPIHKVIYEMMSEGMPGMVEQNLKTINPKTKKLYTRKDAENKAFKDSVEKFFKNPKYKKAILNSLTTTWLAKHLPMGVQKKIIGIGYTTDHKGRKKGTKRGDVEAWQMGEEGPYKGMSDGKQKIRRNPKAMTDITPAMLLSAFVKGQTPTEIKRAGLENISLAITQELGLEVFKADMINDGKLKQVFKDRQELFNRMLNDNFVEEFVRQAERGLTKYSLETSKEITQKTINDANRRLKEQISQKAKYSTAVEIMGMEPIDIKSPQGRDEYLGFFIEKIIPMVSKRTLLAMSGSFTASAETLEKNYERNFLFKNKAEFEEFLEITEAMGIRFGVNLNEQQEQDLYNAVKKEGYATVSLKTQQSKLENKEFKESKKRGFRLLLEMIQNDIQANEKTIPGYAFLMSSSSKFQGHFMRAGAGIDFINLLSGKNREEHTSPITALGKYFFLHMVKGNLFTGGKNSVYDKAIKSYFQGSLPVFMDNRLKLKVDGKMVYNYSALPPLEHLTGILNGDISIWARYFHPNVNNNFTTDFDSMSEIDIANGEHLIGGINPNIIKLANGKTIAQKFRVDVKGKITPQIAAAQQALIYRIAIGENISASKIKSVLNAASKLRVKSQIKEHRILNNAIISSRSMDSKPRGITVLDFDDTLATTKSLVMYKDPGAKELNFKLRPGDFYAALGEGSISKFSNPEMLKGMDIKLRPNDFYALIGDRIAHYNTRNGMYKVYDKKGKPMGSGSVMENLTYAEFQDATKKQSTGRKITYVQGEMDGVRVAWLNRDEGMRGKGYGLMKVLDVNGKPMGSGSSVNAEMTFSEFMDKSKKQATGRSVEVVQGALNAEEYASNYEDLAAQGYTFDFSEFNKVVKGKTAPLFQKALKLQSKFGPESMFVLTARPPAAQNAIFEFLKANGLNIPIKNITGLANSTAEAKALWIADKVGEGYNDFYFADDALQNVQAVKNVLEQFDVKSKVQQARVKFSKDANTDFNNILENITDIESKKRFSAIKARKRGASKGKFRFFIPPSHEDFVGLLYNFIGIGKEGNTHRDFFEKALIRPLNRAYRELNTAKQSIANDYKSLNKQFEDVKKKLTKKTPDGDFTHQDAIRVYLWDKHGNKIPGISPTDQQRLVDLVMGDPKLQAYAETLNVISKQETYVKPTESWEVGDIRTDLDDATGRIGREQYFAEFNENSEIIFSEENLNKIEAAYGEGVRSAIEDSLYRTKTGRNRPSGQNALTNRFLNYLNGSVASTMFVNVRSMLLQQMSIVNFINYGDNNVLMAAKAFANLPQYFADWATIFNSDFMKQRRGGIKTDVNGAELAASLKGAKNTPRALLGKLLELGFLPTQIGDNFAIATGGAPFYRNRINTYLKQGLTQKEAESKAWIDFQKLAEETQQSARPDMVSQQQASPLGKIILAFQNVTSQFNRLGKKAFLDIKNRRITPGNPTQLQSDMSNISRIAYYFAVQNIVFYSLQTALFAMMFDDDADDEKLLKKQERVINGSIDSVLRGTGVWGAVIATLKNMAIKRFANEGKDWNADPYAVMTEALQVSPPLGIKARKLVNAEKTLIYNKKVIEEMETFDLDNPMWSAVTNYIEGTTNAPLNRMYNKTVNTRNALDNDYTAFQRSMFISGYTTWSLDLGDTKKMQDIKDKVKGKKKSKDKKKRTKGIKSTTRKTVYR